MFRIDIAERRKKIGARRQQSWLFTFHYYCMGSRIGTRVLITIYPATSWNAIWKAPTEEFTIFVLL